MSMRWTQYTRDGNLFARPFSQDGPWNRIIPANATYATIGAGWAALDWGFQSWDGDWFGNSAIQATTSDPLFNVLYCDTWWMVWSGSWLRRDNTLAIENDIISNTSQTFPFPTNPYSTTLATNPQTRTFPPDSAYNKLVNPGTLPFKVRVPANKYPAPGTDGHFVIYQPDGMIFECYSAIKIVQAQSAIVTTRYQMIDPKLAGDAWSNGCTASMLSVIGGVVRHSEIDYPQGQQTITIPHAMKLAVPGDRLSTATPAYPALTMDMSGLTNSPAYNGSEAVPMGSRLAIPYSVNLASRTWLSDIGYAMAVAAQRYGFIITDRGGSGLTVYNETAPTTARLQSWDNSILLDGQWIFDNVRRVTSAV